MGKIQFKPSVKKRDSLFLTKHLRLLCLEIIFKNKKLFPRIIFGDHRSEVTLFWGRFSYYNTKLSSRIKSYFQK